MYSKERNALFIIFLPAVKFQGQSCQNRNYSRETLIEFIRLKCKEWYSQIRVFFNWEPSSARWQYCSRVKDALFSFEKNYASRIKTSNFSSGTSIATWQWRLPIVAFEFYMAIMLHENLVVIKFSSVRSNNLWCPVKKDFFGTVPKRALFVVGQMARPRFFLFNLLLQPRFNPHQ